MNGYFRTGDNFFILRMTSYFVRLTKSIVIFFEDFLLFVVKP